MFWKVRPHKEDSRGLARELSLSPTVAHLLFHRGIRSAQAAHDFFCADLSSLASPSRLKDCNAAVRLIRDAISQKANILVVGDYDADGVTATALLIRALRSLKAKADSHIPHRLEDGYGLKLKVIEEAARANVKLLISVDCGTTSVKELAEARRLGISTIVVDHHDLLPEGGPPADAFLNPLRPDNGYPCRDLASVGVAFTLARALLENPWEHLDLVALGTVADVAPLTGENRILVKRGLAQIAGTKKPGLRALLSLTGLEQEAIGAQEISFTLAPRLNAMGRLGEAHVSLELLLTEDPGQAMKLAKTLEGHNLRRRELEQEAMRRALRKMESEINFASDRVIVLEDEKWHPGVIGIIAGRLSARFQRPSIVIAMNAQTGRGSARSIPSFHLVEALEQVKEHLVEFGGHPAAAGLTIERSKLPAFRRAINRVASACPPASFTPTLEVDGELPLEEATVELMREVEFLSPFGSGNPPPIFVSEGLHSGRKAKIAYTPTYRNGKKGSRVTIKVRDTKWL